MDAPLPSWKGLSMEKYDDTTNLDENFNVYVTHVSVYTSDNQVLRQVFPTSLKGPTLSWFQSFLFIPLICSTPWHLDLALNLLLVVPIILTSVAQINIQQDKKEPHRTFMERFSKVILNIRGVNFVVALHHLIIISE